MLSLALLLSTACTDPSEDGGPLPRDQWPDLSGDDTGEPQGGEDSDSEVDPHDSDTDDSEPPATGSGGSGGPTGTGSASVGSVSYAFHVPSCVKSEVPAPVLFTQHGAGGTGSAMVEQWKPLADAECFIVIGQGSQSGNGWNFNSDVEGLSALIDEVDALWNIDTERRVLHGYSAGAHWSYVIGLANSDSFGGLVVYAGAMSYAESYGVWPEGTQGPIPVAIGHGTEDTVVPYAYAQQAESELGGAGWPVELWTASGGSHAYDPEHQAAAWTFVMTKLD
jgi:poly(3-hydroxybutyrate) depolymerase